MMLVPPQMFCKILISRLICISGTVSCAACLGKDKQVHETLYLFLFDRLENLDDALLVVHNVNTFKHFAVLASANLSDNFIVVLIPAQEHGVKV